MARDRIDDKSSVPLDVWFVCILLGSSILSLIGASITIVDCWLKGGRGWLSTAMLINVMLTCLASAVASVLRASLWLADVIPSGDDAACLAEASLFYVAQSAGVLWSCTMALVLYRAVARGDLHCERSFWSMAVFNWGLPLAATIGLLSAGVLGPDFDLGFGCFIASACNDTLSMWSEPSPSARCIVSGTGIVLMSGIRLVGIGILVFVMVSVPASLSWHMQALSSRVEAAEIDPHRSRVREVPARLRRHVLVFAACWLPYTVTDLLMLTDRHFATRDSLPSWLLSMALLAGSSSGWLNALAYHGGCLATLHWCSICTCIPCTKHCQQLASATRGAEPSDTHASHNSLVEVLVSRRGTSTLSGA